MEWIGELSSRVVSTKEIIIEWSFDKVNFGKSYRSYACDFLPIRTTKYYHLGIVPDKLKNVVRFFLFLYGRPKGSEPKITFSASLINDRNPILDVNHSESCVALKPTMKIFEIDSFHPILFIGQRYTFKLNLHLNDNSISVLNTTASEYDVKEESNTSSLLFKELKKAPLYPTQLVEDFRSLHISEDMCDLEIHIDKEVLHAHKLILCARSPVFKKMMEHQFLESSSKSITISDCDIALFKKFLTYLYTGEIEDETVDTVTTLYSLGDKYDVSGLCETCSTILQNKISSDSVDDVTKFVCDVLQMADCRNDTKLKEVASSFIITHFPVMSNAQGWKDLMKSNFELTSEILALMAAGLHKTVYKAAKT